MQAVLIVARPHNNHNVLVTTMTNHFASADTPEKSFINIISFHLLSLLSNESTKEMAEWPLPRILSAMMDTDMWKCRHDGPYTADPIKRAEVYERIKEYDSDLICALLQAQMVVQSDPMFLVRARIFKKDVMARYEKLVRGVKLSPSERLAYLIRGAFNEHRYGNAF